MARRVPQPSPGWNRYAAPVAFLVAATIAVLLVRSALHRSTPSPTVPVTRTAKLAPTTATSQAKPRSKPASTATAPRYYIVQAGDTFGKIAAREGKTVAAIERLNPGVVSTALHVGQKIRVG